MNLSPETVLFTGYAGVLLVAACVLDRLAQPRHTRTWPRSEAARFRRGLALLLIGLATLQLLVTIVRHPHLNALAVTIAPLTLAALLGYRVAERFRRTPTGFPVATARTTTTGRSVHLVADGPISPAGCRWPTPTSQRKDHPWQKNHR